ncbi:MAG: hypothetical protein AUJ85_00910 [Elusimicrobia bacterium CG1_02_37_114]|nr:MAG: hypothetical protein AUJ85_00910 [Elusimicrobia bacterium CG1_02_37_114]PIV52573.1 MAG: hypothetical protein COS17_08410 [Elusimicrobia bacterium CG02_land_8_20_14_3_00_37_13]PIZ14238.1 MAG: hypothetical protein COY53_00650 [Elusimicrobia bacterium CG_4_10_14_0_8_um_filter_37_32]
MIKKLFCLLVIGGLSTTVYAGGVGTTGAQFLKIGPSARSLGMAGAFSAVADATDSTYYNPAGLVNVNRMEVSATYLQYFQDVSYGFISGAKPLGEKAAVGAAITYLSVASIEKRAGDTAIPDSTFGAMDQALTISYARKEVIKKLAVGGNIKLLSQSIDTKSASSFAIDVGGLYSLKDNLSLALNVQNIGSGVKFDKETDPLPMNLKLGVAYRPNDKLLVAGDIDQYVTDQILYVAIGAEYQIIKILTLRAGYKYGYDTSLGTVFSIGLGVNLSDFGLDYAFVPMGDLGSTSRITILKKF